MSQDRCPYKYRLTFSVTIEGDGQHADGAGATATERRLLAELRADDRVVEAHATHQPLYMGVSDSNANEGIRTALEGSDAY